MSRIKAGSAKDKRLFLSRLKIFKPKKSSESNRLGKLAFFVTIALVLAGVVLSGGFTNESKAQSVDPPVEALKVNAFSTSWSCPIAGDPAEGDLVLLTNADPARSAQVEIAAHAGDGKVLGRKDVDVESQSTEQVLLSDLTDSATASLYIESFAGSVVPFRVLNLSDGIEFAQCESATTEVSNFLGIKTVRNSSAQLVLANPYAQAIVVDISAQYIDTSVDPPIASMGESRGVIISARGRTSLNLQKEYGRFDQVNLKVVARSGFFTGEVLQTFDGANDIFGQTIISKSLELITGSKSFIPGSKANHVSGFNNSAVTQSITLEAFSDDNRFVSLDPQPLLTNASSSFEVPGQEFSPRMLTALLESEQEQDDAGVFGSWLSRDNNAVASGDLLNTSSRAFVLPARGEDILYMYNPSESSAKITIEYSRGNNDSSIDVPGQSFIAFPVGFKDPNANVMLTLKSDKRVFVGIANERQSRFSTGINLAS